SHRYCAPRAPHSFPTRRSSDLRRLSIQIGIVEVEPDALTTQRRVRKASDGRYDSGTGPRAVSRQVQIVRPFVDACRSLQAGQIRSEEHTSELQSQSNLVCRLLL